MEHSNPVPLASWPEGVVGRIAGFFDAGDWELRLRELGLRPGSLVEVFRKTPADEPVVVKRGVHRVIVDSGIKHRIFVEKVA